MWRDIVLGMFLICNLLLLDELVQQFKRAMYNYRFEQRKEAYHKRMCLVKKVKRLIDYDRGLA